MKQITKIMIADGKKGCGDEVAGDEGMMVMTGHAPF
jgi:hypothetical protein